MGQGGAFGRSGGAAGELDVDRIVKLESAPNILQPGAVSSASLLLYIRKPQYARFVVFTQMNDVTQSRKFSSAQLAWFRVIEFRDKRPQHSQVIAGLEFMSQNKGRASGFAQCVLQFAYAVSRIHSYQNQSCFGAGKLGKHPLGIIRRPDANAVSRLQAQREQPCGKSINTFPKLGITPPNVLMPHHQRFPLSPPL